MANFIHHAQGTIGGSFGWSFTAHSTSSVTEAAAETAWHTGILAMFNTTSLNAFFPSNVQLTGTYTSTASASWKQTTATRTAASVAGTQTQALPFQVAEVITLRTALSTKYGRGRWYLPPMAPSALDTAGLHLSAAAQAAIVAGANAAWTAFGATLTLVILHRKASLDGNVGALTVTPVVAADVSNKFAIQARRGDKFVPTRTTTATP
jgi:hypothetical protein